MVVRRSQGDVGGGARSLAALLLLLLLLLRRAHAVMGFGGVLTGAWDGARGRGRLARAHGGVVGCADSAAMLGRGSRRRTRCALTRSAQTTATSQCTKHACPSAGVPRPGLRFSPPRKSPAPAGPGPARWTGRVGIGTGELHARFSDWASASAWPWAVTPLPSGERLGEGPPLASLTPDTHQRRRPSPQPSPRGRGSNSQPRLDRRARPHHRSTAAHGLPAALARKPECARINPQARLEAEAQTARNPGGRP